MPDACAHLPQDLSPPAIESEGCQTCLIAGKRDWVHLRFCQGCGRVGCCDNSPGRHATRHAVSTEHPLIRSFEPGEDWWYCYVDDAGFDLPDAPPAPSHP